MAAGFIPSRPADVTPEWVTEAMRAAGALEQGSVVGVAVESIVDGGTGFTGETVRLRLDYRDATAAPPTVIAKFATGDRQNRGMLEQFDAYAREIRFYQRYADRMPCPIPGYLGADYDRKGAKKTGPRMARVIDGLPERVQLFITRDVTKFMRATDRRYALLIEDLGAETTVHDMVAPPDDDQVATALRALATLHAAFWRDPSLDGDDAFRQVLTNTPGLYRTVGRRRCLALGRERWDWLSEDRVALVDDALERFPDDVARVNDKVTLVHGDGRADNILYRHDGEVVLLDWALAGHAHPGFDVGYLLSSCVEEDRVASIDPLLEEYHSALTAQGVSLDASELREVVVATYRAMAVQQLMSIAVLHGGYGDDLLADIWMPRVVAGLEHLA